MAAAQEKHSKPGPLKLVIPPNPCQRPIGTSASNSIDSEIFASSSVFGQLISRTPSMVEMAQPRSRLVPKVPSLSLRSLKTGLVARRSMAVLPAIGETLRTSCNGGNRRTVVQIIMYRQAGADHVDFRRELPVPRSLARSRLPHRHESRPGQSAGA